MERRRGSCPLAASCLPILHSNLITRAGPGLCSTWEMPLSVGMGGAPLWHPCPRPLPGQRPLPESAGATRVEGCVCGGERLEGGPPPGHVSPCACPLALRQPARILRAASPSLNLVDAESEGRRRPTLFACSQLCLLASMQLPQQEPCAPGKGSPPPLAPPPRPPPASTSAHIWPQRARVGEEGPASSVAVPWAWARRGEGGPPVERPGLSRSRGGSARPSPPAPRPPRSQP